MRKLSKEKNPGPPPLRTDAALPQPGEKGTYLLILFLDGEIVLEAGSRKEERFPAGCYAYIGSAQGGLLPRLGRHLRSEKKLRWHIDYLLRHARIVEIRWHVGPERLECTWARAIGQSSAPRPLFRGFGSSDCRCPSHLFYLGKRLPRKEWIRTGPVCVASG